MYERVGMCGTTKEYQMTNSDMYIHSNSRCCIYVCLEDGVCCTVKGVLLTDNVNEWGVCVSDNANDKVCNSKEYILSITSLS